MGATIVDTKHVSGRRQLEFGTLDDILTDAEMLAGAGRIRALGNWTPGQLIKHVAIVMNTQIDGTPLRPPWIFRMIGRYFIKKRLLKTGMRSGFQLPKDAVAFLVPPATTTIEEGMESLRAAVRRLKTDHSRAPSPFLGPMTEDESNRIQCRHAELHLSFLVLE